MKTKILPLSLLSVIFFTLNLAADPVILSTGINKTNIDLNSAAILGQLNLNTTSAGFAVVHFDGVCISDPGDLIVLAASNSTSWGPNDGNVSVEAASSDINSNSFSHTRVYDIPAGNHIFYAVAENYSEKDGSGIATIYGNLTVKFFPEGSSSVFSFEPIDKTTIDLNTSQVVGQVSVNPGSSGKVIVHFDGNCIPDPGDLIVLAASNTTSWGTNDGNVSVEAVSADVNNRSFSHTRVYNVSAGNHTYYAIAQNWVETDGSGVASVYGCLTAEFIPDGTAFGSQGIVKENTDLTNMTTIGQVTINPSATGKVIVHLDGLLSSDPGDRIVLAASNTTSWGVNDGNVTLEAFDSDINTNSFSHTRVYNVSAGSQTYYAVAHNTVETDGSGIASVYGNLTAEFIPDAVTAVNDLKSMNIELYPDPVTDFLFIRGIQKDKRITVYSVSGTKVMEFIVGRENCLTDLSELESGLYFIKIEVDDQACVRKIIKK